MLHLGLVNTSFLAIRCTKNGVDQRQIVRALTYLLLVASTFCDADELAKYVLESACRGKPDEYPDDVKSYLLGPIIDQLLSEMQDVCGANCARFFSRDPTSLCSGGDEIKNYWVRLEKEGLPEEKEEQRLFLMRTSGPCEAGFGEERSCPLFEVKPSVDNLAEILRIVQQVAQVRSQQAAEKRREESA